jgi:hypothetical protein
MSLLFLFLLVKLVPLVFWYELLKAVLFLPVLLVVWHELLKAVLFLVPDLVPDFDYVPDSC